MYLKVFAHHRAVIAAVYTCLLTGSLPISFADQGPGLTLDEAIERTLQHNPELHRFTLNRQRYLAERDSQALKPGYSLDLDIENFAGSGNTESFDSAEYTLALSSVIELGDQREARIDVIDHELDKVRYERQAATLDVLGRLTSAFIEGLSVQEQARLAEEAVALAQDLLQTVNQRARQGAASDAEVMRARASLTRARIAHANQLSAADRQRVKLGTFWGDISPGFASLQGDLYQLGPTQNFDELYTRVERSPAIEVLASESRLKAAQAQLVRSQGNSDLDWQLGVRRFETTDDTALIFGISVPLFTSSRNQSAVKAVRAEEEAAMKQRDITLLALHAQLYAAWSQRQQHSKSYQQLHDQVIPDLEQALSLTREAYDRGRLRYQDWIAAQEELLDARKQQIENATNALLKQAVIEQLTAEPLNAQPKNK